MEKHSKPVGIWIRVSTEDQAHGESPTTKDAPAIMPNPKSEKSKKATTLQR